MNPSPELVIGTNAEDAAGRAGDELLTAVSAAAANERRLAVALSGGTTPGLLYDFVVATSRRRPIEWHWVDWFFGDERCVPPDSGESNFGLAHQRLFEPLGIAAETIHRIHGEIDPPALAAADYERSLRGYFRARNDTRFDLVMLGIGAEGHTASLFPGSDGLEDTGRWVLSVRAPASYATTDRVTLTLPVINRARAVFFLAVGAGKQQIVRDVLSTTDPIPSIPAARVRPGPAARLVWFLDQAAAADLG